MFGFYLSGCFFTLLALSSYPCWAQSGLEYQKNQYCITSLANQPRPTFFSFKRYQSSSYQMHQSDGAPVAIDDNSSIEINLRVPLILRPGLKMVGSFTYYDEDFEFVYPKTTASLSNELHNKPLRSFNSSFYIITPFRNSLFLTNRLQASLNGDFYHPQRSNYLNYSLASVLGWRKSDNTLLGAGLYYSVDFDGGAFIPLLAFQHVFSPRWTVDALLPSRTSLQYYSPDRKNVVISQIKLNGPEYNIDLNYPGGLGHQYIFERNEIRWSLHFQREIHDWLWFGTEAGFNTPISADWLQAGDRTHPAFETNFNTNFFTTFSLFMVVPQKLFERNK